MSAPRVIGITGGIGSGKSTIAEVFSVMGFPVYDSDKRARDIYLEPEIRKEAEILLGSEAYNSDGTLNRKYVASKVFQDKSLLEKINNLIHPAVKKDFEDWKIKNASCSFVVKESALLFETGIYKSCFKTLIVTAEKEIKVLRVMKRDNISREDVLKKMENQWSDEEKIKLADFVIDNSGRELVLPTLLKWIESLSD
jgi:dephospho-CoA kinase